MRIISKFKDYYDCHATYDKDDPLWVRTTSSSIKSKYNRNNLFTLSYCGKYYPFFSIGYSFGYNAKLDCQVLSCGKNDIAYTFTDALTIIEAYNSRQTSSYWKYNTEDKKRVADYFLSPEYKIQDFSHPLYIDSAYLSIINPCLKDIHFYTVKSTFEAYQDIEQFVTGVLGQPQKEIPVLDDITMRDIKGFDKFSFRKDKK